MQETTEIMDSKHQHAKYASLSGLPTGNGRSLGLRTMLGLGLLCGLLTLGVCRAEQLSTSGSGTAFTPSASTASKESEESHMWITVGEHRFAVTLADNDATHAFAEMLPLTLNMAELNGNEKYASLSKPLPVNASRPGTIRNGDLMLYGSGTLVLFYQTFSSSYSYTPIGHVNTASDLAQALGSGSAQVTFSKN